MREQFYLALPMKPVQPGLRDCNRMDDPRLTRL
jgi:hypothetical protein